MKSCDRARVPLTREHNTSEQNLLDNRWFDVQIVFCSNPTSNGRIPLAGFGGKGGGSNLRVAQLGLAASPEPRGFRERDAVLGPPSPRQTSSRVDSGLFPDVAHLSSVRPAA